MLIKFMCHPLVRRSTPVAEDLLPGSIVMATSLLFIFRLCAPKWLEVVLPHKVTYINPLIRS